MDEIWLTLCWLFREHYHFSMFCDDVVKLALCIIFWNHHLSYPFFIALKIAFITLWFIFCWRKFKSQAVLLQQCDLYHLSIVLDYIGKLVGYISFWNDFRYPFFIAPMIALITFSNGLSALQFIFLRFNEGLKAE